MFTVDSLKIAAKKRSYLQALKKEIKTYISNSKLHAENVFDYMIDMDNKLRNQLTQEQKNELITVKLSDAIEKSYIPQEVTKLWEEVLQCVNICDKLATSACQNMDNIIKNGEEEFGTIFPYYPKNPGDALERKEKFKSMIEDNKFGAIFLTTNPKGSINNYYKLWYLNSVRKAWINRIDEKLSIF